MSNIRKVVLYLCYAIPKAFHSRIYGSMDFNGVNNGAALKKISDPLNKSSAGVFASAQRGLIPWVDSGYHVQLKAIANDVANPGNPAILSELVYYFNPGDVKP